MSIAALVSAFLLFSAQSDGAAAQPAESPSDDVTTVEGVTVRAAPRTVISEFVRDIAATTRDGKLARWNKTICPATIGVDARYGQYINDRVALAAIDSGLRVAEPGCKPDILILVTDDSDTLVRAMATDHREMFGLTPFFADPLNSPGADAFKRFVDSQEPVRWWHVARKVPADGRTFMPDDLSIRVEPSRLRAVMRQDFAFVMIVVDTKRAHGASLQAISDYVAMVALAQIEENVVVGEVSSILNIFHDRDQGRTPVGELTDWDKAFLKGLYTARLDAPDGATQRNSIVTRIERERGKED